MNHGKSKIFLTMFNFNQVSWSLSNRWTFPGFPGGWPPWTLQWH